MPRRSRHLEVLVLGAAVLVLPLSTWASPLLRDATWPHLVRLVASLALFLVVARRHGGRRADVWRFRAYLASGAWVALVHDSFLDNELAGVLTLFLPLTVALALSPALDARPRRLWRFELVLLTVLFGLLLAGTGSRGGLLSAVLAGAVVLAVSGRRGRILLGLGVAAAATGTWALGVDLAEMWIFEGSVQGWSLDVMLHGRSGIWYRALHAVADFPWTGMGLGTFGSSLDALYPGAEPLGIEDAHNLFLQTALDLGVPGLLAFLALAGVVVRRLVAALPGSPRRGLRRAQLLGLLGALLAHLLFSLTDSVSLGSPGNVAWWLCCGLAWSVTGRSQERGGPPYPGPLPRGRGRRAARRLVVLGSGAIGLVCAWSLPGLGSSLRHNRAAVATARVLVAEAGRPDAAVARLEAAGTCRSRWLRGLLAREAGRARERDAAWAALIRCSPRFFELLQAVAGEDRRLAGLAVETWEGRAEARFWLARALVRGGADEDRAAAVETYRQGLALRPSNARAWVELGNFLARYDAEAALEAYGEACLRGDPGANGCVRAGAMAEKLGDVEGAVRWYRASRWGASQEEADRLERQPGP